MDELLTARQVQEMLKVDRITVYRMLKDGRLAGIKIGHEWRFSQSEVNAFLTSSLSRADHSGPANLPGTASVAAASDALPLHCVQLIQNVFADVAEVGALTATPEGEQLTEISNSCRFCNLMRSTPKGRAACMASWRKVAARPVWQPFTTCHAGLQYAHAAIALNGKTVAAIIAGQFYTEQRDEAQQAEAVARLAEEYGLNPEELLAAARELQTLDERKRAQMGHWLESVARTFADIGRERSELVGRLRSIAAMSVLSPR